jgi:hypothetical protein
VKKTIPVKISAATVQHWSDDIACLLMQDMDLFWIFSDKNQWIRNLYFSPGEVVYVYWAKRGHVIGVVSSDGVSSIDELPTMDPITE